MSSKAGTRTRLAAVWALVAVTAAAVSILSGVAQTTKPAKSAPLPPKLTATVSTSGQVSVTASTGRAVTRLHNGWYTVGVTVDSPSANFHLVGPRVQRATRANFTGVAVWGVHFLKGAYRYLSDRDVRATTHVITVY